MNTRHIATLFLAAFIAIAGACSPETTVKPDEGNGTEQPGKPGTGEENPGGEEKPGEGNKPEEGGKPGEGENPGGSENPGEGSTEETVNVTVLNPGATKVETKPTPQHPDFIHNEEYHEFYNPLQGYLDDFGNIDYVCAQGKGTDWPRVLDDYSGIRFYQSSSASKNGGYIRVRAHNGAKLLSVTVGSATLTKIAHSVDGRAKKSETKNIDAGGSYTVEGEYDEVCFYCMGTTQSERWEMNSIKVRYRGGFIEEDFQTGIEKEYGPLVRVDLPLKEGFENGFPTTDKPSYYRPDRRTRKPPVEHLVRLILLAESDYRKAERPAAHLQGRPGLLRTVTVRPPENGILHRESLEGKLQLLVLRILGIRNDFLLRVRHRRMEKSAADRPEELQRPQDQAKFHLRLRGQGQCQDPHPDRPGQRPPGQRPPRPDFR